MGLLAEADLRFDALLRHLLDGLHCRRAGWSTGAFLRYVPGSEMLSAQIDLVYTDPKTGETDHFKWRVSQDDILAVDWQAFYGDVLPRNPVETRKIPASA